MKRPDILQIIRRSAMFAGMNPVLQEQLLAEAQVQHVQGGATVFLQGEPANAIYVVAEGAIKLYRMAPSGAEAVVTVMTCGRSFGEAMALMAANYPVSAEAIADTVLVRIDADRLRQRITDDPRFAMGLLAGAYAHLQSLVSQIEQLKARSGVQRVAEFLITLSGRTSGRAEVRLPHTKALMAARLGLKPESLSRAFVRLRKLGVTVNANVVTIDDMDRLHDLVAEDPGKSWSR